MATGTTTTETIDVVTPAAGESVTEGTILEWHVQVGDFIKVDDTIVEISTDKVDVELPSPASGTVVEILAPEGETVTVGQVIARLAPESATPTSGNGKSEAPAQTPPADARQPAAQTAPTDAQQPAAQAPAPGNGASTAPAGAP